MKEKVALASLTWVGPIHNLSFYKCVCGPFAVSATPCDGVPWGPLLSSPIMAKTPPIYNLKGGNN